MWVHLGLFVLSLYVFITSCVCVVHNVCIVLGLSLVFLVFFVYMLIGGKGLSYLFYHNRTYICQVDVSSMWHTFLDHSGLPEQS